MHIFFMLGTTTPYFQIRTKLCLQPSQCALKVKGEDKERKDDRAGQ